MSELTDVLTAEDLRLVQRIITLTNQNKYELALDLVYGRLSEDVDVNTLEGAGIKSQLAGRLIDIGSEGHFEGAAKDGIRIYLEDYTHFKKFISEASMEYNLGNGKAALFNIRRAESGFQLKPDNIDLLIESKNHYWRSQKLFGLRYDGLRPQLLVNLANALSSSGRIVEALQYRDLVLREIPDFPHANASLAGDLLRLKRLSDSYSITLLQQAAAGYYAASKAADLPESFTKRWKERSEWVRGVVREHGYSEDAVEHDQKETEAEYKTLSTYRQFCMENYLALSEHSLYCKCLGARHDNLTIPKTTESIGGNFVPKMEHVLNRLKSEYALARLLYFQVVSPDRDDWETHDEEVDFTELYDDEAIGTNAEMLRTSFRLCFGTLDKIGRGICDLFELADAKEPIYFESFWKPRGNNLSEKQRQRWIRLNSIDNFPLLALYSQATDLNSNTGEWGVFKEWRNDLEHKMLALVRSKRDPLDLYGTLAESQSVRRVQYEDFREKTLHLLQLTRSAIFNFVFCVRREGERLKGDEGSSITLDFKTP